MTNERHRKNGEELQWDARTQSSLTVVPVDEEEVSSSVRDNERRRERMTRPRKQRHHATMLMLSALLLLFSSTASTGVHSLPFHRKKSNSKQTKTSYSHWRNSLKNGLASAGAAACCKTLLHPIDCVKTIQQYSPTPLSFRAAVTQLVERRQLFAGLAVTVFGSMPSVAVYFGVYAYVRERLLTTTSMRRVPAIAVAAAVGNSVASITRVPYETAKQRLQAGVAATATTSYISLPAIQAQMLRDIPYAIITLVVYETLQRQWRSRRQGSTNATKGTTADFLLGGLSGGIGSWLTNPMDVIKTRVQVSSASGTTTSIPTCIQAVWAEGGASALLRGSVPRLLHKVPANAFFFLFYELFQRILGVENSSSNA